MADEKQLTVAELLARNRKDGETTGSSTTEEKPPRRRRRSLEDGGVSVAELTGSFKAVKASPAESRHSSVPLDTQKEAEPVRAEPVRAEPVRAEPTPAKRVPSDDDTGVIDKVVYKPAVKTAATPAASPAGATETGVIPRVEAPGHAPARGEAPAKGPTEDQPEKQTEKQTETESHPGVTGAILLAIIGIVVGVVTFLLFQALWGRFSIWLVALLALAVTAGFVAVVHRLRTASDGLSMALAGLVGLVLTLGPAAIVLS